MFNSTWEIGVLINSYSAKLKALHSSKYDFERERLKDEIKVLYARAIELTCKKGYGLIMPIELAIDWVKGTYIIDSDGSGDLLDRDGNEIENMRCDVSFLQTAKETGACFVAWYNK